MPDERKREDPGRWIYFFVVGRKQHLKKISAEQRERSPCPIKKDRANLLSGSRSVLLDYVT